MEKKSFRKGLLAAVSLGVLAVSAMTVSADTDLWANTKSKDADGNICIDFEEIQVVIPGSWSGKCQMSISDTTVSFYHIKSRELWTEELGFANGGWLFSITCTQDQDYLDLPHMTIGTGEEGIYYVSFPTDLQGYVDDAEAIAEFGEMGADVEWVKDHITLTSENNTQMITADGDYIIPESSTEYLEESDLEGMSADEIQMAINEIYARHHRKFVLKEVQEYFDSKDWYTGTVEADEFDVGVMNQYEGANIDLMTRRMQELE